MTFLDEIGGLGTLRRAHKVFYDDIFGHAWFSQIFEADTQEHLENQQTDFMAHVFGGANVYCGRPPATAHQHIMITDEMFDERSRILKKALLKIGLTPLQQEQWLQLDDAFRKRIVKTSVDKCKGRFNSDPILNIPNPDHVNRKSAA